MNKESKRLQTEVLLKDSECTEETYFEMLGCLPPRIMVCNAFLVGEPTDHDTRGFPRYELYFEEEGKFYYGGKTTLEEFYTFLIPKDHPLPNKTYMLTGGKDDKCISNGNSWEDSLIKN